MASEIPNLHSHLHTWRPANTRATCSLMTLQSIPKFVMFPRRYPQNLNVLQFKRIEDIYLIELVTQQSGALRAPDL